MDFSEHQNPIMIDECFKNAETGTEARSGVNWPDGSGVPLRGKIAKKKVCFGW